MVKFFTGNNPSPYVSDAYKGKLPLGEVRAQMEKRGLAWTPEIEAKLFRVAGDLVFDDTLPEEPLIDADPAGAFAGGLTAGATGNRAAGSFFEDPLGNTSHLAGMLMGAGKAVGAVRAMAPKIPGIVASGLGMGAYSGVDAAGSGASAGDVAKQAGIGALTGGALHGVNMIPGALTYPGQAAVFGGMEAMGGGSLQDVLAAAALGPLAGKAVGGFPGRGMERMQEVPVMPPEVLPPLPMQPALPGRTVRPPELMPPAEGPRLALPPGQAESAIRLPGDIITAPVNEMTAKPYELTPMPERVRRPMSQAVQGAARQEPVPVIVPAAVPKEVMVEMPKLDRSRAQMAFEAAKAEGQARAKAGLPAPELPTQTAPDATPRRDPYVTPDTKAVADAVGREDLAAAGIMAPETGQMTRAQRRQAISDVMNRPRPVDLQKAAVEDAFTKRGYRPEGDEYAAALERFDSSSGLVRSRRRTGATMPEIEATQSPVANDLPPQGTITPEAPRRRLRASSTQPEAMPKAEQPANGDYEPLGGIDYRNRKTGEIVTKIGDEYIKATPEYAARVAQKSAGVSRAKPTGEPVNRDVTLGVGLGGVGATAQRSIFRPAHLPKRQPVAGVAASEAAHAYMDSHDVSTLGASARKIAAHKPSQEYIAALPEMGDVSKWETILSPRTHAIQAATGGRVAGKPQRELLGTIEDLHLAAIDLRGQATSEIQTHIVEKYNIKPRSAEDKAVAAVSEYISTADASVTNGQLLGRPEIAQALGRLSPARKAAVLGAAKTFRRYYDRWWKISNDVRKGLDLEEIPYRANYFPHMEEVGFKDYITRPSQGRSAYQNPSSKFTPSHARRRTGSGGKLKDSALEVGERWGAAMADDIGNNMAMAHMKSYIEAHKAAGQENAAHVLQRVSDVNFGGKADPLTMLADAIGSAVPVFNQVRRFARWASGQATQAQLGGNIGWTLTTGPSSGGLVDVHVGAQAAARAKEMMRDPEVRAWAQETSYAVRVKSGAGGPGGAVRQDVGGRPGKYQHKGPMAQWAKFVSKPGEIMEREITTYAFLGGFAKAKMRGLSDAEAITWGDDIAKKTQSMYDRTNRAELSASPDFSLFTKYSTFAFEMTNKIREVSGIKLIGRTGAYKDALYAGDPKGWGPAKRLQFVGRMAALVVIQNLIQEELTGRPLWNVESLVPGMAQWGGQGFGKYGDKMWVEQFALYGKDAIGNFVETGDPKQLTKYLMRYFIPAGSQMLRTYEGAKAISEGGTDRYPIDFSSDAKKAQALVFGPHATQEGREYWDGQKYITIPVSDGGGGRRKPSRPSAPDKPRRPR